MFNFMSELFSHAYALPKAELLHFRFGDSIEDFEGRPNIELYKPQVKWEELASVYGLKGVSDGEKILNLKDNISIQFNPSLWSWHAGEMDDTPLICTNWITNYDIKAANKGYFGDKIPFSPVAVQCILKTKENQILFGVRGLEITPETKEKIGRGLYGVLPAGWVTFDLEDPIAKAARKEFLEEVGNFSITYEELIGVFKANRPGPINTSFVYSLRTDATFEHICRANREANNLYEELTQKKASKSQIAEELRKRNLPPDAYEHSVLLSIPDDKKSIETLVNSQPQSFTGIGAGALITYTLALERRAEGY